MRLVRLVGVIGDGGSRSTIGTAGRVGLSGFARCGRRHVCTLRIIPALVAVGQGASSACLGALALIVLVDHVSDKELAGVRSAARGRAGRGRAPAEWRAASPPLTQAK